MKYILTLPSVPVLRPPTNLQSPSPQPPPPVPRPCLYPSNTNARSQQVLVERQYGTQPSHPTTCPFPHSDSNSSPVLCIFILTPQRNRARFGYLTRTLVGRLSMTSLESPTPPIVTGSSTFAPMEPLVGLHPHRLPTVMAGGSGNNPHPSLNYRTVRCY